MFKFQPNKFEVMYVGLKALSKATINPKITLEINGESVKMDIPTSIARIARNKLHNVTKFSKAYPVAVALMDERIVAIEVANSKQYKMYNETGAWLSILDTRDELIHSIASEEHVWDGQYLYKHVGEIKPLGDGKFGFQEVRALNMYHLSEERGGDAIEPLAVYCYKNPVTGEWIKTAPVTRVSGEHLQISGDVDVFSNNDQFVDQRETTDPITKLDSWWFVNLRFVNYAARALSNQFGYDVLEPLGLPLLMIEHRTFNLGGLSTSIQASSPAPIGFKNTLAWLIGMHLKVKTLDDFICMKQTLKMLTSKGTTANNAVGQEGGPTIDTKHLISQLRKDNESAPLIQFD